MQKFECEKNSWIINICRYFVFIHPPHNHFDYYYYLFCNLWKIITHFVECVNLYLFYWFAYLFIYLFMVVLLFSFKYILSDFSFICEYFVRRKNVATDVLTSKCILYMYSINCKFDGFDIQIGHFFAITFLCCYCNVSSYTCLKYFFVSFLVLNISCKFVI